MRGIGRNKPHAQQVRYHLILSFSYRCMAILIAFFLLGNGSVTVQAADTTEEGEILDAFLLQQIIDAAPEGTSITLPAGTYEGSILIDKSIEITTAGQVTVQNLMNVPAVSVLADKAVLKGLDIIQKSDKEYPAVMVAGDHIRVENVRIQTSGYGIMLREAHRNEILDSEIKWVRQKKGVRVKLSDKSNGIDLLNSDENRIIGNKISRLNDGIYIENSNSTWIENNEIDNSRYGVHCMYTERTVIQNNVGSLNMTGAMVMIGNDVKITNNRFYKQSESAISQGLLLYDVQDSHVQGNTLEGNRIGVYMEMSKNNEIYDNAVIQNFVGIQLLTSEGNRFYNNQFVSNVIEAEATDSKNNSITGNYWDSFQGIDLDGDGISNTPYEINPFFQVLTAETQAYQLFFQSPGMQFLESMFNTDRASWSKDDAPLMQPMVVGSDISNKSKTRSNTGLIISGTMLCLSLGVVLIARRKKG